MMVANVAMGIEYAPNRTIAPCNGQTMKIKYTLGELFCSLPAYPDVFSTIPPLRNTL